MQRGDRVFPINNALSLYFAFAPQCFSCLYRWSEQTSLRIPTKSHNPCRRGAHRTVHLHRSQTSGRYPSSLLKGPVQPRWKLWGSIWSLLNSHSISSLAAHRATLWFVWQLYSYLGLALISVAGSSIFQAVAFLFYDRPNAATFCWYYYKNPGEKT